MSATSAPASNASIAARIPAQPAPTTRTSCFASTTLEAIERGLCGALPRVGEPGPAEDLFARQPVPFEATLERLFEVALVRFLPRPLLRRHLPVLLLRHRTPPRATVESP